MAPELFDSGMQLGAIALIIGAVLSFVTGTAPIFGGQVREAVRPVLADLRSRSSLSRRELADRCMLSAVLLSVAAVFLERSFMAAIIAVALWTARPMVARLASQEHPLLAIADSLSIDLMIGLYLPVAMAQMLLGRYFTGSAMLVVILALSWPAGGGARRATRGVLLPARW